MRIKIAQFLVAWTLVVTIGGHWALLQSIAWAGMILNYTQNSTLAVALTKTFDGKHPCQLCKVVQEGKHAEKKHDLQKVEIKWDFCATPASAQLFGPVPLRIFPAPCPIRSSREDSPPIPPPRLV